MKNKLLKTWYRPELIIISKERDIHGGGPNLSLKEIHTGNHKISSVAHGGSGTVSTAAYKNVMS